MSLRVFDPAVSVPAAVSGPALPILSRDPLPETHWPYYSRKLECWWLLDCKPWQVLSLTVGPQPMVVYRLAPASFAWFWKAVDNLASKAGKGESARWATSVLDEMDAWLTSHGLSDEVRKWRSREVQALPEPPKYHDVAERQKADYSFGARRRSQE